MGIDENGMTTARKLYDFLELNPSNYSKWIKRNIIGNEFAEEGKDYYSYQRTSEGKGNFANDYKLISDFAKKLSMTAKNEKGEQARAYFVTVENKARDTQLQLQNLSPELRLLISLELKQNEQEKQLKQVKDDVKGIREVVAIDHTSWRDETSKLLRKISTSSNGEVSFKDVRNESYKLLERRMGVNLPTRLTNKRRRMLEKGVCKSKIEKTNSLDVIADDKKLIEGYIAIVKEIAIKYGL